LNFPNDANKLSRDVFERLRNYEEDTKIDIDSQENLEAAIYSAALDEGKVYELLDGNSTFDLDEEFLEAF
jgi:hypothetical protein